MKRFLKLVRYLGAMQGTCPPPLVTVLWLTDLCNARCAMCHIWQEPEPKSLDLPLLQRTYEASSMLQASPILVLGGGEPILRPDLPEWTRFLSAYSPYQIRLASNCLNPGLMRSRLGDVLEARGTRINVKMSLDSLDPGLFDRIRGSTQGLSKRLETLAVLKELRARHAPRLSLSFGVTIMHHNIAELEDLLRFSREHDFDFIQNSHRSRQA